MIPIAHGQTSFFNNLNTVTSGWQTCQYTTPPPTFCAGGTGIPTGFTQNFGITSPPLIDSNSMQLALSGPADTNGGYYYNTGASDTTVNLQLNMYFYAASIANLQALENDQYQYLDAPHGGVGSNTRLYWGTQCVIGSVWDVWDSSGIGWVSTGKACSLTAGTTHHLVVQVHRIAGDTSCTGGYPCMYYDIILDGTLIANNQKTNAGALPAGYSENTGMMLQIDTNSSCGSGCTAPILYDKVNETLLSNGGPCVTGAGAIISTLPAGVTSCWFMSPAAGSDSNDGLTESTPFQNAPCAANATSNAAAACVSNPGTGWIFKGGETVTSASFPINVPFGGTSGAPTYWGYDPGWYAGGSWSQYILNFGGSAGYNASTQAPINDITHHASYFTMDGFQATNFYFGINCSNGGPEYCSIISQYAYSGSDVGWEIRNGEVDSWSHCAATTSGCVDPANNTAFIWAAQEAAASGTSSIHDIAFIGANSSHDCCGVAAAPILYHLYVTGVDNWIFGERLRVHDNAVSDFVYTFQTSVQDGQNPPHGNCEHFFGSSSSALVMLNYNNYIACWQGGGPWTVSTAYSAINQVITPTSNNAAGNSFRATTFGTSGSTQPNWTSSCGSLGNTCSGDGGVTWTNLGNGVSTADEMMLVEENAAYLYDFNNVRTMDGHGTMFELANNGSGGGNYTFFNDTSECGVDATPGGNCFHYKNGTPTVTGFNNFFVTSGTPITPCSSCWVATFTPSTTAGAVISAPIGTGNGIGNLNITETYPFAPLDSSAATTIGTGGSVLTYCSTIAAIYAAAGAACLSDTTLGVTYPGTLSVSYPARVPLTRNVTNPTNGAYQFYYPNYSNASQSTAVVQLPNPIPSVGGLIGAGTCVTPSDFGLPICRLTDSLWDPQQTTDNAFILAGNDERKTSCPNSSDQAFAFFANPDSRGYVGYVSPASGTMTHVYSANPTYSARGGFSINASDGAWSWNCATTPNLLYVKNTVASPLSIGIQTYDFTSYFTSPTTGAPVISTYVDFRQGQTGSWGTTSANALATGTYTYYNPGANWSEMFGPSKSPADGAITMALALQQPLSSTGAGADTISVTNGSNAFTISGPTCLDTGGELTHAWITVGGAQYAIATLAACSGGTQSGTFTTNYTGTTASGVSVSVQADQDSGYDIVIYKPGLGFAHINTATGVVTSDFGMSGTINIPERFYLHGHRAWPSGQFIFMSSDVCVAGYSCTTSMGYLWDTTSLNVYILCSGANGCGGHNADGFTHIVNAGAPNGQLNIRPIPGTNNPYTAIIPYPPMTSGGFGACSGSPTEDTHISWQDVDALDSWPVVTASSDYPSAYLPGTFTCPLVNELYAVNPITGVVYRFAHNFLTGANWNYSLQNAFGSVWDDGNYQLFNSDWTNSSGVGTLGRYNLGAGACVNSPVGPTACRGDIFVVSLTGAPSAGFPRQINAVQPPQPSGTNSTHYQAVLAQNNIRLSGQTVIWGGGNSASSPGFFDTESGAGLACAPVLSFTSFNTVIGQYGLTNLLLAGVTEGNTNSYTPPCVFSQAQANASYLPWTAGGAYLASDYIFQSGDYWQSQTTCANSLYDATCIAGGSLPTCFASHTSPCSDNQISWVQIGTNAPLQDAYCGPSFTCGPPAGANCYTANGSAAIVITSASLGPCTLTELYQAEVITSELPYRAWFIGGTANAAAAVTPGVIAQYSGYSGFGYLRVGCTAGGECDPLGLDGGLYPWYGSTNAQRRATYLSWVKILDTAIQSFNPTMPVLVDLNCAGNPSDCSFADQEDYLARTLNFTGDGTNALDVNDVLNLMGIGPNNCAFPLVAASGCTTGDFAYLFATYQTNAAGAPFWHSLQTATATTPLDCAQGLTGPLFIPAGISGCSGFPGLLPFLVRIQYFGIGSPNTKIPVNNLELYTNPPATSCTLPNCDAGDVLLALDTNYSTSTGAQSAFVPYQAAEAAAFYYWLFPYNPPVDRSFVAQVLPGWWNDLKFAGEQ
jgi:hypothetical protein